MLPHYLPRHEILQSNATLITGVPEINQWHLREHAAAEADIRTIELREIGHAAMHMTRLSALYLQLGPGDHISQDIVRETDMNPTQIVLHGTGLEAYIPDMVTTTLASKSLDGKTHIRFGNIALAERRATREEQEDFSRRVEEAGGEKLMYKKNELYAQEQHKIQLTAYDHALIRFRDKNFSLELKSPEAILAIRLMQYISDHHQEQHNYKKVHRKVWRSMTIAERMLFTNGEVSIFNPTFPQIAKPLDNIERNLLRKMGIFLNTSDQLDIIFEPLPPEKPYDSSVVPIYPPGTDKELTKPRRVEDPTEAEALHAEKLLRMAASPLSHKLSQEQAIDLLDQIMDDRVKQVLRIVNGVMLHQDLVGVLDALHTIARRSLGWNSYTAAFQARTIAGGLVVKSGKVELSGGQPNAATTLWHIGEGPLFNYKELDNPRN